MLLSLIPNLSPLVLGMAVMVLAGVGLDPGTVMIASVALGIVVDDTMHFMVRYQRRMTAPPAANRALLPAPHPIHAAVRAAMQETARPSSSPAWPWRRASRCWRWAATRPTSTSALSPPR